MPLACPQCTLEDILTADDHFECATCGYEWLREREVKDANGNTLKDGDSITLVKELKVKGGGLKIGAKAKNIRLVDGDHEIDCTIDGVGYLLKASFVKKA